MTDEQQGNSVSLSGQQEERKPELAEPARFSKNHILGLSIITILIVVVGWLAWDVESTTSVTAVWLIIAGLMLSFMVVLGWAMKGLYYGVLIDERNKISLSRLQVILWTLILIPGYFAVVTSNQRYVSQAQFWHEEAKAEVLADTGSTEVPVASRKANPTHNTVKQNRDAYFVAKKKMQDLKESKDSEAQKSIIRNEYKSDLQTYWSSATDLWKTVEEKNKERKPLDVLFPPTLLVLMGISAGSAVVSIMLKEQNKGGQARNENARQATMMDMFRSEGSENSKVIDIGKVQMFFFTLILMLMYIVVFAKQFFNGNTYEIIKTMPEFEASAVVLLAISHAGYLTYKATSNGQGKEDGRGGAGGENPQS